MIFKHMGWQRIVGFHTRNVAHRAHEYIQLAAMDRCDADGLFIHPVIGPKKPGDFSGDIILKTYQHLISNFYPSDKTLLGGFSTYSRYAGPREAVFTGLCRQNFGCSHFIVGRDHTGVGDFYAPEAARNLFEKLHEISIQPIFFDEIYYCDQCENYVQTCKHGAKSDLRISGSRARELLKQGQPLPEWYMRKELSELILEELRLGGEVFTP